MSDQGEGGVPEGGIPVNDDTTSATDDSSVGFGNRPEEFVDDTSTHDPVNGEPRGVVQNDGPPEEPGIDKERDLKTRLSASPDSEIPD